VDRQCLPDRRPIWTQAVRIPDANKVLTKFYLSVGEYPKGHPRAGQPGEIWIVVAKEGTFIRGVLDNLAREVSKQFQRGVSLQEVCDSLRGSNYPPQGKITAELTDVTHVASVADWIAQELENAYLKPQPTPRPVSSVVSSTELTPTPAEKPTSPTGGG
jgi:ribonucleoside-diphosphate reductase alpha chain